MQDEFLRYLSSLINKYLGSSAPELPFLQKQTRKPPLLWHWQADKGTTGLNNKVAGGRKPMATMKLASKQPEIFVLEGLTWLSRISSSFPLPSFMIC
jgi:hypothetical protein